MRTPVLTQLPLLSVYLLNVSGMTYAVRGPTLWLLVAYHPGSSIPFSAARRWFDRPESQSIPTIIYEHTYRYPTR